MFDWCLTSMQRTMRRSKMNETTWRQALLHLTNSSGWISPIHEREAKWTTFAAEDPSRKPYTYPIRLHLVPGPILTSLFFFFCINNMIIPLTIHANERWRCLILLSVQLNSCGKNSLAGDIFGDDWVRGKFSANSRHPSKHSQSGHHPHTHTFRNKKSQIYNSAQLLIIFIYLFWLKLHSRFLLSAVLVDCSGGWFYACLDTAATLERDNILKQL